MTLPFRPARPLAFLAAFADAEALLASGTLTTKNATARDEGRKVLGALLTEIGQERECSRMSQERVETLLRAAVADAAAVAAHVATLVEPAPVVEPELAVGPVVEDDTAEIAPEREPEPEPTVELEIAVEPAAELITEPEPAAAVEPEPAAELTVAKAQAMMTELGITHEQVHAALDTALAAAPVEPETVTTVTFADADEGATEVGGGDADGEPGDNDHGDDAGGGDADGFEAPAAPVAPAAPRTAKAWTFTWGEGDSLTITGPVPTTHPEVNDLREALYRSGVARGLSTAWKGWPAAPLAAAISYVMQRPCGSDDVSFLNWKLNAAAHGSDPRVRLPAAPATAPTSSSPSTSAPRTNGRTALPTGRAKASSYITFGMTDEAAAALDRFSAAQGHGSRMATARAAFRAYFAAFGEDGAEVIEALGL